MSELVARGYITIADTKDGVSVMLTPNSCVIHADYNGANPTLTNANTQITAYCGDELIPIEIQKTQITPSISGIGFTLTKLNMNTYQVKLTSIPDSELQGYLDIDVKLLNTTTVIRARFMYVVERETSMLDWIKDWESNKTTIGDSYVITPKLFVGTKIKGHYDSLDQVPGLTGVYIGPNNNGSCGVYGYNDNEQIFKLDDKGGSIGGWSINHNSISSIGGGLEMFSDGSIRASNPLDEMLWEIKEDGSAIFAKGNVSFKGDGSAFFKGEITSESGKIANWSISNFQLSSENVILDSSANAIGIASLLQGQVGKPVDIINSVHASGGVLMFYNSWNDYGFVAYSKTTLTGSANKVFSTGSSNYIAGWNFDDTAIWIGAKNNTANQYASAGSLTIGTEGLRGESWYINKNGTASFGKGMFVFDPTSATLVGWNLSEDKLANNNVALVSQDQFSGLYLTSNMDADFITLASSELAGFIQNQGGIFLNTNQDKTQLIAYDTLGNTLFHLQNDGINQIAGWKFNTNSLYVGRMAYSKGFAGTNSVSIGPTGIRGYKWRFETDGSGALAGGNVAWDSAGNITLSDKVKLKWAGGESTIIGSNGLLALNISADKIQAGTISTADIKSGNGSWWLKQDGSGCLANNNIEWSADGSLAVTTTHRKPIILTVKNYKKYTKPSNLGGTEGIWWELDLSKGTYFIITDNDGSWKENNVALNVRLGDRTKLSVINPTDEDQFQDLNAIVVIINKSKDCAVMVEGAIYDREDKLYSTQLNEYNYRYFATIHTNQRGVYQSRVRNIAENQEGLSFPSPNPSFGTLFYAEYYWYELTFNGHKSVQFI